VSQQEIEIILSRHLFSHLTTPIFLVDPDGNLLYYNESAEPILGRHFAETGEMSAEEWSTIFQITDDNHVLLEPHELPLSICLAECRPVNRILWLVGLDNVKRHIETTCIPLMGEKDRFLGAVAFFWERKDQ